MMKESPLHPRHEEGYFDAYGFDLQEDFSKFLEEARNHGKEAKQKISSVHPEENVKKGSETEKKIKKSWKKSLISWWKSDKKNKQIVNPTNNSQSHVSGKRKGHVSGPIYNNTCKGPEYNKLRHPTSGPIISLFKPTKKMEDENEIPYVTLHQQNSLPAVQSYGPVYVVT